jgi:hypothetical protein
MTLRIMTLIKIILSIMTLSCEHNVFGHNGTKQNDIELCGIQHYYTQHNDIQHYNTQHNDTHQNYIEHNDIKL